MSEKTENAAPAASHVTNFIRNIINDDLEKNSNRPRHWSGQPGPYSLQESSPEDPARIRTRFPPEPNGYLHIGHCKSICLNFGLARDYGGHCHMRFDDTNPVKEDQEYVDSIVESVRWLGFDFQHGSEKNLYFASDYFEWMYEFAEHLIRTGYAYVDEQTADEMHASRGTLKEPGKNSPYRDRTPEENLRIFREMRDGKHAEGSMVLRAKIDMASRNMNLRDPAIYRIRFADHHRTGSKWCIYPMYTFAHPIEDSLENITHSICTLEFEDQRPFYNWALERIVPALRAPQFEEAKKLLASWQGDATQAARFAQACAASAAKLGTLPIEAALKPVLEGITDEASAAAAAPQVLGQILAHPENFTPLLQSALSEVVRPNFFMLSHQYEFNRLNLTYVVLSKRKLITLVKEHLVDGWDDPRMPTIVGLRRRGFTPEALQLFAERIGLSKQSGGWIDYSVLEGCLREDLDARAQRRIAVLNPLKLIVDNYPADQSETLEAPNHPLKPELGTRPLSMSRELWIERADFEEVPSKGYRRLTLGTAEKPAWPVRLRYGYVVRPVSADHDAEGNVTAVHVEYLPETRTGSAGADSVKAKAAIHWLDAATAVPAEIRVYDRLFSDPEPDGADRDFRELLTPNSKKSLASYVEPAAAAAAPDTRFQFERNGYFVADRVDHTAGKPVFNLAVTLKDTWNAKKN